MEKKNIRQILGGAAVVALVGASIGVPLGISYTAVNDKADMYAELAGRYEGRTGINAPRVSLDSLEALARNAGVNVDSVRTRYNLPQRGSQ